MSSQAEATAAVLPTRQRGKQRVAELLAAGEAVFEQRINLIAAHSFHRLQRKIPKRG
jgi:hypothetical protein